MEIPYKMLRLAFAAAAAAFLVGAPEALAQGPDAKDQQNLADVTRRMSQQVPSLQELISRAVCDAKPSTQDRGYCYLQAALEQQDEEDRARRFNEALRRLRDANIIELPSPSAAQAR